MRQVQLAPIYESDIRRAVEILKGAGCTQIFLFGSLATGQVSAQADIDLAVRGCPKGKFFHLLGRLALELKRPVDLVDLDSQDPFARYLEEKKELLRVD
jgi:predicted nucleotidyltransferase